MPKKSRKNRPFSVRTGETAPRERRNHGGGLITEIVDRDNSGKIYIKRERAREECILDAYLLRNFISLAEHEAGMKFKCAYYRAVLGIKIGDGSGSHGDSEMAFIMPTYSEGLLRQAYSVLEVKEKNIIFSVCADDNWAGGTRSIKVLQSGLQKLTRLWRIN